MKKWLFFILIIIAISIGMFINVYVKSISPLKKAEEIAVMKAQTETNLVSVNEIYLYNGSETSYAIQGVNEKDEEMIVFVPEKDDEKIVVKKASDGITKEQAIQIVQQEKNPVHIVSVKLGMEKQIPLWEVYYKTDKSSLNYYYIDFQTGEWLKKIENL